MAETELEKLRSKLDRLISARNRSTTPQTAVCTAFNKLIRATRAKIQRELKKQGETDASLPVESRRS
jgi:YD repeat-containing protein